MNEKKYLMDQKPVSAREIIKEARTIDSEFDESHFYQTSVAARILRNNGYEVGNNLKWTEQKEV